jgi:hypothetical protein
LHKKRKANVLLSSIFLCGFCNARSEERKSWKVQYTCIIHENVYQKVITLEFETILISQIYLTQILSLSRVFLSRQNTPTHLYRAFFSWKQWKRSCENTHSYYISTFDSRFLALAHDTFWTMMADLPIYNVIYLPSLTFYYFPLIIFITHWLLFTSTRNGRTLIRELFIN